MNEVDLSLKLFDHRVMTDCKLLDAAPDGRAVFGLTITDEYANLNGAYNQLRAMAVC